MCCLAGVSICVRVRQDKDQGLLFIQDGDIVHAECGDMQGVEAFFTVLEWPSGQFETLEATPILNRSIKEPYQFLLMEAVRRSDERAQERKETSAAEMVEAKPEKLKVLIVDDSAIMSKILTSMLVADPGIEVVGNAKNGEEALKKMKQLSPNLITMDVNMPVMDGSTALKHIMIESPCPVLIMSNLAPSSYGTILSFLNLGAVDFMSKPVKNRNIIQQQQRMVDRVHLAVSANIKRFQRLRPPKLTAEEFGKIHDRQKCEKLLIAISGVGGYLEMVNTITSLPGTSKAGLLSLQSIPPLFAPTLAEYLNARSRFEVLPLTSEAPLCPGRCYIGNSAQPIEINPRTGVWVLNECNPEGQEKGNNGLDHLLSRIADFFKDRAVVVLLSGGEVGSMEGLRRIRSAGGQIVSPQLDKCILPVTIAPVAEQGLINEQFNPKDLGHVLKRYCT